MYEHAFGYTVQAALDIARSLKYGPLWHAADPVPAVEEAIALIRHERKTCGFNWITGELAEAVIRAYGEGRRAKKVAASPYPPWSDEHKAWQEGKHNLTKGGACGR